MMRSSPPPRVPRAMLLAALRLMEQAPRAALPMVQGCLLFAFWQTGFAAEPLSPKPGAPEPLHTVAAPDAVEISRERFLQRLERNSLLLERFAAPKSALATPTLLARPGITLLTGLEVPNAETWLDRIDAEQSRLSRAWQLDPAARNRVELIVHLRLGESENRGLTLPPIDRKSPVYRLWVSAPNVETLSRTLAHELTHVVLEERFAGRLPVWANEGLASCEDDRARQRLQAQVLHDWLNNPRACTLRQVLERERFAPSDTESYAVATSFVQHLQSRMSQQELIRFLDDLCGTNLEIALARSSLATRVDVLERDWKASLRTQLSARTTARR